MGTSFNFYFKNTDSWRNVDDLSVCPSTDDEVVFGSTSYYVESSKLIVDDNEYKWVFILEEIN